MQTDKKNSQYNYTLDTLRVIAAVFVVLIHLISIYYENGFNGFFNFYFYRLLLDIAVPIFFASMGYVFLSPEFGSDNANMRNKLSRLSFKRSGRYLKYYILTSVVYILMEYAIVKMDKVYLNFDSWEKFEIRFTLARLIDGTIGGVHLWFLMAAVISFFVFGALFRVGIHPAAMIFIAGPLYFLGHVMHVPGLHQIDLLIADEGLFMGMFYISLGMFVRALTIKYNTSYIIIAVAMWILFPFIDYYKVGPPSFIILIVSTLFLMIFARSKDSIGKHSKFIRLFAKYNLFIYLFHLAFLRLSNKALSIYYHLQEINNPFWKETWYFPSVFILAIIGPIFIYYLVAVPLQQFKKK
ncbi:hypothetical protein EKA14_19485 [Bacillus mycoides]|nr:hypothetical protein EKA14_19485 [Bacillus mycoides]